MWVDIDGYFGAYSISNLGEVRSNARSKKVKGGGTGFVCASKKQLQISNAGYATVNLYRDGKAKKHLVHRLVASAFIDNVEKKPQVNHINGNKLDNAQTNLEWVTASENCMHAIDNNLYKVARGEMRASSKLTERDVVEIKRRLSRGDSRKIIAIDFPVSEKTIGKIARGELWSHVTSL